MASWAGMPYVAFIIDVFSRMIVGWRVSASMTAELTLDAGVRPSVGSTGDSCVNALAESIIELFKTEVIRRRGPWKNFESVALATLEWANWFNNRRLLEPIGNVPPAEFEQAYYDEVETSPEVAGLT